MRQEIQGLRAVAVLLVVLFHLWPDRLPGGYVGVDVFFVISGFLITSLLLREADQNLHAAYEDIYDGRRAEALKAVLLLEHCARISGWLLPPVSSEGHPEQLHAAAAATRLRAYLSAHDGG